MSSRCGVCQVLLADYLPGCKRRFTSAVAGRLAVHKVKGAGEQNSRPVGPGGWELVCQQSIFLSCS